MIRNVARFRTGRVAWAALALGVAAMLPGEAEAGQVFSQGFETDTSGWSVPTTTRVSSGTDGVTSATGNFHAQVTTDYTDWGGYSSVFPAGGYTTSLSIYLDLNQTSNDIRFDWTSAINNSSGGFLRDFVFNGGFYNDNDSTGSGARFVFSASNNAGRANSYPKNPARDPFAITQTGWYDFQHTFYDNSGVLAVDLSIIDHTSGSVLKTWTLSNSSDLIAGVGGNRYGWFPNNEFGTLAIDNATLTTLQAVPEPSTLAMGGVAVLLSLGGAWRHRRRKVGAATA